MDHDVELGSVGNEVNVNKSKPMIGQGWVLAKTAALVALTLLVPAFVLHKGMCPGLDDWSAHTKDRISIDHDNIDQDRNLEKEGRQLQSGPAFHAPKPECFENEHIFSTCSSLKAVYPSTTQGTAFVVPCGTCYIVDYDDGSTIDFPNGLRVEGKLHFSSESSVNVRTKFVLVLGLLKIDTPAAGKQVKFTLYGESDIVFNGADPTALCGGTGCNFHSKVIAVLGGKLDIKGYDSSCPAWEKLADTAGLVHPLYPLPCNASTGLCTTLKITGACVESPPHSSTWGKYTVKCPIQSINPNGNWISTPIRLVGSNGKVVNASKGVLHWSRKGTTFFFWPDVTAASVASAFPAGTSLSFSQRRIVLTLDCISDDTGYLQ